VLLFNLSAFGGIMSFLSTKHQNPACGFFAVVARISCPLKTISKFFNDPVSKSHFFRPPVKYQNFVEPRYRFRMRFLDACQTAFLSPAPIAFQVAITNKWSKPDSLSSRDKYAHTTTNYHQIYGTFLNFQFC